MRIVARNLACIADRFPALANQLRACRTKTATSQNITPTTERRTAPPRYRWQNTRNGGISMQRRNADDEWIWLYSSVNPQREAARIVERIAERTAERIGGTAPKAATAAQTTASGTAAMSPAAEQPSAAELPSAAERAPSLIIVGQIGNGYLIEELLARFETADIIVIVSDIELCACALEARDLCPLLRNPRLALRLITSPQSAPELIGRLYLPALHGKAILLWNEPLATHVAAQREVRDALQQALREDESNLAIYRQLGRVWMRNILINGTAISSSASMTAATEGARPTAGAPPTAGARPTSLNERQERQTVSIVAAGPSLDRQLAQLRRKIARQQSDTHALISTDSALPALRKRNIAVDACVTLDCQLASYLHFRGGVAAEVPLYADLAAHPLLCRIQRQIILVESTHPLSLILSPALRLHRSLSRAEHVTQSAFALAIRRYSPQQITLYGADYSYLVGKGYARGTYIPLHHMNRSNLTRSLELQSLLFSWQHNDRPATTISAPRIIPHFFRTYRAHLLRYAVEQGYDLTIENDDDGMVFQKHRSPIRPSTSRRETTAPTSTTWLETLTRYRTHINALLIPTPPYHSYLERLSHDEILALLSLLPLMVHIERRPWRMHSATPFETARQEIRKQIAHCIALIKGQAI